jgi:hypothetical protein
LLLGFFAVFIAPIQLGLPVAAQEKVNPGSLLPRAPAVAPENALSGAAMVEALRRGGFVLYLRHTETGEISDDCNKSNLTEVGRSEAKRIGSAIRALRLPIDKIISSDVCRVIETAKLMDVAPLEINEDLHRGPKRPDHRVHEARNRLLASAPAAGTNRLLAGHMQAGESPEDRLFLDLGEIIVFRPNSGGRPVPVARVRAGEWQAILDSAGLSPAK